MRKKYRKSHRHRGGYSSAATYQEYVNGTSVTDQMNRTFNPSMHDNGNLIIGAQGQNSMLSGTPSSSQLALIQSAGRHRRHSRRGGNLGAVLSQASVPLALLAAQQTYRRKKGGKHRRHKTRRHH